MKKNIKIVLAGYLLMILSGAVVRADAPSTPTDAKSQTSGSTQNVKDQKDQSQTTTTAAKTGPSVCGDGVCDDSEKSKGSCNQDCATRNPKNQVVGSGQCGDNECDAYERRTKSCPLDCNLKDVE